MITVLVVRDPDGGTDVTLFDADGRRMDDIEVVEVDAGRGHSRSEWNEWIAEVEARPKTDYRDDLLGALYDPPGAEYINESYLPL